MARDLEKMSPTSLINHLIFSPRSAIQFGGNLFINVPVILQVEGTALIETITNNEISRTTQFTIFHSDGVLLATVVGTCAYPTVAGEKAGLTMSYPSRSTVCSIGDSVLFEVRRVAAASLAITAELFSPTGLLVKANGVAPFSTIARDGRPIATAPIRNKLFRNSPVGYSVNGNGESIVIGAAPAG